MKLTVTLFLAALLGIAAASAQTQPGGNTGQQQQQNDDEEEPMTDEEQSNPRRRFWEAKLPGGHFQVELGKIVSLSMHEYVLDGAVVVTEVTIDTVGQALPRFYFIEPVSDRSSGTKTGELVGGVVDRGRELIERAASRGDSDLHEMVHKKYGVSTHTKTLEYRLYDFQELSSLYNSVRRAWDSGRGRKFTIR